MAAEINLLTGSLLAGAIWAIICRIRHMDPARTRPAIFFQHAALAFGLFAALWLPPPYAKASLAAGVFVFLMVSSRRWRFSAPDGTDKPEAGAASGAAPLDLTHNQWRHVQGGKR